MADTKAYIQSLITRMAGATDPQSVSNVMEARILQYILNNLKESGQESVITDTNDLRYLMMLLLNSEPEIIFSESDTIEGVDDLGNGSYGIYLRRKWDGYYTSQVVGSVLKGMICTKQPGNSSYYTSYFRVNAVNVVNNYLAVTLYANSGVPSGKNFPPVPMMMISRFGHQSDTKLQTCIKFERSTNSITVFSGVTKPIIDKSNYQIVIGSVPSFIDAMELPEINGLSYTYIQGIITSDIIKIGDTGKPIYVIVDLGLWASDREYIHGRNSDGQYITNQVWFGGCSWQCAVDKATVGKEPRWNNPEWICVFGASNFTLDIYSSNGILFRKSIVSTKLTAKLMNSEMDITDDVPEGLWIWTRESTIPAEDEAWNVKYINGAKNIDITDKDLPSNWSIVKRVIFRLTVKVTDGIIKTTTYKF